MKCGLMAQSAGQSTDGDEEGEGDDKVTVIELYVVLKLSVQK